ncbi:MBL fold metallo-hydrolase [Parvularcula flava]|uniref:MBL fold metallo-hydrolase n=1 Tax=Aquisalinus luteolus TaxID=1566827 RepID=A0A8J3ERP8_9PROT|nr:MBL fold metallo-hydrolase [Aquisalinus luteolus]NHK28372.1 MBL fold metallo-hydrolase [Aquisalinus luteolus]GGH98277.1 MBL fold metallo-hydrolase [Aquisalinus luteolus]
MTSKEQGGAPDIQAFFDEPTNTVTYLVSDPETREAAIIDPVLDYDHASGDYSTRSSDAVLAAVQERGLKIVYILETHAHADHLSSAPYLKAKTGAKVVIGAHIGEVQKIFRPVFDMPDVSGSGAEFDILMKEGDTLALGELEISVLETPGHTPACIAYHIGDAVFVGDTMFMPDYGTARADFPGGDARTLYRSVQKILSLPPETRLFMCHDYLTDGRKTHQWETTVAEQKARNIHIHDGVSEDEFVAMREKRDAGLRAPTLLLPSIQVNIRAGILPAADENGITYLKVPVRLKEAN